MQAHPWPSDERPIAPAVEQVLTACLLDVSSREYNEVWASMARGALDDAALAASLQDLVDRHEVLRQGYSLSADGNLVCRLHPAGSTPMEVQFVSLLQCASPGEAEVQAVLQDAARRPFVLHAPPLFRTTVVHLAGNLHLLAFTYCHVILDGPSRALFGRELAAIYNARLAGQAPQLRPLPFTVSDFATWQQRQLADDELVGRQLAYWRKQLAGAPDLLQLPTDKPRPAVASNDGAVLAFVIEGQLFKAVQAFMKANRQSMIRVFTAAFVALLSRYSGQRDILVMLPRSIRPPGTESLVGHFINPLAVRVQVEGGDGFIALVKKVAQALKEAVAHGDVSYQRVVDEVCTRRSRSHTPLTQAVLTINEEDQFAAPALVGTTPEVLSTRDTPHAGRSLTDIQLKVRSCSDHVLCHLEYNTDILEQPTVQRMADNLVALLSAALAEPEAPVDTLPMISPGERQMLLSEVQGHQREGYCAAPLLFQRFTAAAAQHPHLPCLMQPGRRAMSYRDTLAAVAGLAQALHALRLPAGAPVGMLLERTPEWVVAMLACLATGHPFVPMEPSLPQGRLVWYLQDACPAALLAATGAQAASQAQALLVAAGMEGGQPGVLQVLQVDCENLAAEGEQHAGSVEEWTATPDPSATAYILFTSGSTGRPKGVMVTQGGLRDLAEFAREEYALAPGDINLVAAATIFDACILQATVPVAHGVGLLLVPPGAQADAQAVANLILHHRPQPTLVLGHVPTLAREYLAELRQRQPAVMGSSSTCTGTGHDGAADAAGWGPGAAAPVVRVLGCGGEPLPPELAEMAWQVLPCLKGVINIYGPTEVTVMAITCSVPRGARRVFIGPPDANVHAYVVDQHMQLVPLGVAGELLLSGPRVSAGYVGRPDLTADKFIDNPFLEAVLPALPPSIQQHYRRAYRTGDLVAWKKDGAGGYQLDYLGRIDRQVKVNGVRLELAEVEAVLAMAPGVAEAVVSARKTPAGGDILVAYLTPATVAVDAVLQHCRNHLLPAMVPGAVVPLPAFPLNPSGKTDVAALPNPFAGSTGIGSCTGAGALSQQQLVQDAYAAPDDEMEATLQRIWTDCLHLPEPLSCTADFFGHGGTSLQLFRLTARMQQELGLATPLAPTLVYTTRTIRATAQAVARVLEDQEAAGKDAGTSGTGSGPPATGSAGSGGSIIRHDWEGPRRPVSANQAQMWLLQQQGMGTAYNMQAAMSLSGPVHTSALQAALQYVLQRHEVLRTALVQEKDGALVGQVLPPEEVAVPLVLAQCGAGAADVRATLQAELATSFDLSRPPCLRALLLRHSEQQHTLCITMHHAFGDGWSFGVLMADMSAAYNAAVSRGAGGASASVELVPPPQPALPIQYADFAQWQHDLLSDAAEADRLRQFWRQQLRGCLPVIQLATDRPRPVDPAYTGSVLRCSLGQELQAGMKQLARQLQVSQQAVLLAAVQTLLLRYSNQDEVTIGVPTAGRQQQGTHALVGYFVNPLPIRTAPRGAPEGATFADLARQAAHGMLDALSHSALPLQQVVEAAAVSRQPGVSPLFQVLCQVFGEGEKAALLSLQDVGAALLPPEALPAGGQQAKMDLVFEVDAGKGELAVTYMTELYDETTIQQLAASLQVVLAHAAARPGAPIVGMPLLDEQGVHTMLSQRYCCAPLRPDYLAGPLVHQQFEAVAAASPDSTCLVWEGESMSYGEVNHRANQLAHALIAAGVCANKPTALLIDRSADYVIAVLAVWKAGGCFLPCDPSYPLGRLAAYVEDGVPVVLLAQAQHKGLATTLVSGAPSSCKILVLEECWAASTDGAASATNPLLPASPASTALILFTSGSTGRPKGAALSHLALMEHFRGAVDGLQFSANDASLLSITCGFDPHLEQMLLPLLVGGKLVIASPLGHMDPPYIVSLIQQWGVTMLITVPSLATLYLEEPGAGQCTSLRLAMFGGEVMTPKLAHLAHRVLPQARLINLYGPTEATIYMTGATITPDDVDTITIGRPQVNVHCYVVGPADGSASGNGGAGSVRLMPVGAPGELLISGPCLAAGYWNRADTTAAAFVSNPFFSLVEGQLPEEMRPHYLCAYRTGDLVRWRRDGTLEYLGRIDHQVKINGVRMELGEIDAALATAPGVAQGVTVPQVLGDDGRKRLVAYVTPAGVAPTEVQAHCRSRLIPAMVPAVVVALDALPLLPNGKIDRKALPPPPDIGTADEQEEYVAPRDEVEAAVQAVWMDVLGVDIPISTTSDFFVEGGSSLKAGIIQARLREALNVPALAGTALMQHPTIEALAAHIRSLAADQGASAGMSPASSWARGYQLAAGFSSRWLAGHSASTRQLLQRARTFCEQHQLEYLSAEDPRLPARFGRGGKTAAATAATAPPQKGLRVPPTRLPYSLYLVLQYLLLVLGQTVTVVGWLATLLLLATAYRTVGTWWLLLLWAPIAAVKPLVGAALSVVVTWVLLPRGLKPGVYPLYGWLHCRWAAVRGMQRRIMSTQQPLMARTPMLNWLLRLWGAHVGQGAILDSAALQEPQLLSVGAGTKLGHGVMAAGAMVVPAGVADAQAPALLMSKVVVGAECEVGHKAVLPAGARLADGYHLKPRAAPSHVGAVGKGPLVDTPEFCAEEHLGPALSMLCAVLAFLLHNLAMLPGLVANVALLGCIIGENPFAALAERLLDRWQLGESAGIQWPLVLWPCLFTTLFFAITRPLTAVVHTLLLVLHKRLVLGPLPPGTQLTRSRWLLWRYALYRRMLGDPAQTEFKHLTFGTTIPAAVGRWLGTSIGPTVFLGGLTFDCHDAVTLGDRVSSGGDSHIYCVDAQGLVCPVVIEEGATVGNSAVLYPGCRLGTQSLVGNDTVVSAGASLAPKVRLQGGVRYTVDTGKDAELGLNGGSCNNTGTVAPELGGSIGGKEAEGVAGAVAGTEGGAAIPRWHTVRMVAAQLAVSPIAPVLRYSVLSFPLLVVIETAGWVGLAMYCTVLGAGICLASLWLKLLPTLVGMHRHWKDGAADVFSISAVLIHTNLSSSIYAPLLETPFMAWVYRAMGFRVGKGAVLMGHLPLERTLVSIGAGAVVEGSAFVEGHYLESQAFAYRPCRVGERAWVQQGARVMPGVEMGAGARLLPGSTVLPGEVLAAGTLWGGGIPASPQGRANALQEKMLAGQPAK